MTGPKLRAARRRLGWTQRAAAGALGVSPRTLSRWECNAVKIHPSAARFVAHLVAEHATSRKRAGHRR